MRSGVEIEIDEWCMFLLTVSPLPKKQVIGKKTKELGERFDYFAHLRHLVETCICYSQDAYKCVLCPITDTCVVIYSLTAL